MEGCAFAMFYSDEILKCLMFVEGFTFELDGFFKLIVLNHV